MSLGNSTVKDRFGDLLIVDNSGSGLTTTLQSVKDGNGSSSALELSDDNVKIRPQNDNTSTTLSVNNAANTSIFSVNTSSSRILANSYDVNTSCFEYACFNQSLAANTWTPLHYGNYSAYTTVANTMGTSSNPATTFDVSGGDIANSIHQGKFLPFDIVVTSVQVFYTGDSSSSDNIEISLNSFDISLTGAGAGDLSNGTILYSSSASAYDNTKMYYKNLSATSTSASGAKTLMFFAKQNGTNNDLHAKVYVSYYIKG